MNWDLPLLQLLYILYIIAVAMANPNSLMIGIFYYNNIMAKPIISD